MIWSVAVRKVDHVVKNVYMYCTVRTVDHVVKNVESSFTTCNCSTQSGPFARCTYTGRPSMQHKESLIAYSTLYWLGAVFLCQLVHLETLQSEGFIALVGTNFNLSSW